MCNDEAVGSVRADAKVPQVQADVPMMEAGSGGPAAAAAGSQLGQAGDGAGAQAAAAVAAGGVAKVSTIRVRAEVACLGSV